MDLVQFFHAVGDYVTGDPTHELILFGVSGLVLLVVFAGMAHDSRNNPLAKQVSADSSALSSRFRFRLFTSGLSCLGIAGFISYLSYSQPEMLPFPQFMGVAFAGAALGIFLCGYALYSMTKE